MHKINPFNFLSVCIVMAITLGLFLPSVLPNGQSIGITEVQETGSDLSPQFIDIPPLNTLQEELSIITSNSGHNTVGNNQSLVLTSIKISRSNATLKTVSVSAQNFTTITQHIRLWYILSKPEVNPAWQEPSYQSPATDVFIDASSSITVDLPPPPIDLIQAGDYSLSAWLHTVTTSNGHEITQHQDTMSLDTLLHFQPFTVLFRQKADIAQASTIIESKLPVERTPGALAIEFVQFHYIANALQQVVVMVRNTSNQPAQGKVWYLLTSAERAQYTSVASDYASLPVTYIFPPQFVQPIILDAPEFMSLDSGYYVPSVWVHVQANDNTFVHSDGGSLSERVFLGPRIGFGLERVTIDQSQQKTLGVTINMNNGQSTDFSGCILFTLAPKTEFVPWNNDKYRSRLYPIYVRAGESFVTTIEHVFDLTSIQQSFTLLGYFFKQDNAKKCNLIGIAQMTQPMQLP